MYGLISLLSKIDYKVITGSLDREITELVIDSRKVSDGSLFICIPGYKVDGHSFAKEVVERGAKALIIEKDLPEDVMSIIKSNDVTLIRVEDSRYAMAFVSAAYFGNPADELKVIGITGTKGKTTTTYLVKSILENAGYNVGLIGTIEIVINDKHIPASNTTPESFDLQRYFKQMKDEGIDIVVMEVASQGLKLHRTQGFMFELGIFTNLEPDHIGPNEHADIDEYIECKGRLFKQCRLGIVNADDKYLLKVVNGHTCNLETFGFNKDADLYADKLTLIHKPGELGIEFDVKGTRNMHVTVPNPGRFSVYNALCAIAICEHFNVDNESIKEALLKAKAKGRIEMVKTPYPYTLLIDYAHNAMSLESLLTTLKEYEPRRLIVLFGCGGNRSKDRRYGMGETAGKIADLTIITSDNPRDEEPQAIIDDIKIGMQKTKGKYVEIIDRKAAIRYAMEIGQKGDIIVLAGKGHEDYQEIKGVKYPMDERVIIKEILEEK